MKKSIISALFVIMLVAFVFPLAACFGDKEMKFDNDNIVPVESQDGFYTDPKLSFCAEIRGSYKSDRPFTLDEQNDKLRIWDNMYLYERDYFQMIVSESPKIFYSVQSEDLEYVEIDNRSAQATIKEGQSGIYKVIFDLSTNLFDLEYKGEIIAPVYE